MKKDNTIITRLARSAVATGIAACAIHQTGDETKAPTPVPYQAILTHELATVSSPLQVITEQPKPLTVAPPTAQWDKKLEKEFRSLALKEAKGEISQSEVERLEHLNALRDRLLNPQPAEEILRQIRRDRLLGRMQGILNEYVEFEETTGKTRTAA